MTEYELINDASKPKMVTIRPWLELVLCYTITFGEIQAIIHA